MVASANVRDPARGGRNRLLRSAVRYASDCRSFCTRKHAMQRTEERSRCQDAKHWGEKCGFPNRFVNIARVGAILSIYSAPRDPGQSVNEVLISPEALLQISLQFLCVNPVKSPNTERCSSWPDYHKRSWVWWLVTTRVCCSWLFYLRAFYSEVVVFNSEDHGWHFSILPKILVPLPVFLELSMCLSSDEQRPSF